MVRFKNTLLRIVKNFLFQILCKVGTMIENQPLSKSICVSKAKRTHMDVKRKKNELERN